VKLNAIQFLEYKIEMIGDRDADSVLLAGCKSLEILKANYWLSGSTLLGIHRDGKQLSYSMSVEIGVRGDKCALLLIDFMQGAGFKFAKSIDRNGIQMQMVFVHAKTGIIFDVLFFHKSMGYLYHMGEYGTVKKKIFELGSIDFQGRSYPIPGDVDAYLS